MICPVCGKYEIEEEWEGCRVCGWIYDGVQTDDEEYPGGSNYRSVVDYRRLYKKFNGKYDVKKMNELCPVCDGDKYINDVCEKCGWIWSSPQYFNPNDKGNEYCDNEKSLNEYREMWSKRTNNKSQPT